MIREPVIRRFLTVRSRQWLVSSDVCSAVVALALLIGSAQLSSAGNVTATRRNPGDRVTDGIQINSIRSNDAIGVQLPNPPAANTVGVAGTLDAIPVAIHDAYPRT